MYCLGVAVAIVKVRRFDAENTTDNLKMSSVGEDYVIIALNNVIFRLIHSFFLIFRLNGFPPCCFALGLVTLQRLH